MEIDLLGHGADPDSVCAVDPVRQMPLLKGDKMRKKGPGRPRLAKKKKVRSIRLHDEDWYFLSQKGPTRGQAVESLIEEERKKEG